MIMLEESHIKSHNQEQVVNGLLDPFYAEFRDQTRFWIQRVAVPLIMVVGLFGNLITVIIMTRRRMRSTTNLYLAALALVDMLYLVLTFLLGLSHYPNMVGREYYIYWKLRPFLMMLTDTCSNTSVWLTVTFTIERFIAVKYPIKGKVWCTEARAKKLIMFVFFFGILFASPVPFEWKVVERLASEARKAKQPDILVNTSDPGYKKSQTDADFLGVTPTLYGDTSAAYTPRYVPPGEQELPEMTDEARVDDKLVELGKPEALDSLAYILSLENTDFGRNETYKTMYYWSTAVIFYFIPLLSLTFFNGFLILSVHRSFRERNRMTTGQQNLVKSSSQSNQITKPCRNFRIRIGFPSKCKHIPTAVPKIAINSKEANDTLSENQKSTFNRALVDPTTNRCISWESALSTEATGRPRDPDELTNTCSGGLSELESDTCHRELAPRPDLATWSTDKTGTRLGYQSGRDVDADDHHEHDTTSSLIIDAADDHVLTRAGRTATINCDSDNNGGSVSNVQTICDKTNQFITTNGSSVTHQREFRPSNGTQSLTTSANGTEHNVTYQINQLENDDGENDATNLRSFKQERGPKVHADSGPSKLIAISDSKSGHSKFVYAPLAAKEAQNDNNGQHADSSESNSSISGKFHLINPHTSLSGSSGLATSNNYGCGTTSAVHTSTSAAPVSTQERRITIMLIAVVILFLCCQIPSAAMLLYTSVREPAPNTNEHALVLAFGNIFNFLMAVNAAGNFILYSFLSKKYRKTFMIIFCDCLKSKRYESEERPSRTVGYMTTQQLVAHHSTSSSGMTEDCKPRMNGGSRQEPSFEARFVRSKSGYAKRSKLQVDGCANYQANSQSLKHQRRDTLV